MEATEIKIENENNEAFPKIRQLFQSYQIRKDLITSLRFFGSFDSPGIGKGLSHVSKARTRARLSLRGGRGGGISFWLMFDERGGEGVEDGEPAWCSPPC